MDKHTRRLIRLSSRRQRQRKAPTPPGLKVPGMSRMYSVVCSLILVSSLLSLVLYTYQAKELLRVAKAWVLPTAAGQTVGVAYMQLRSSRNATIVKVEADVASSVEIYQRQIDNGVARMQRVDSVELPAGQAVALASEAHHLELIDLRRPLVVGDRVRLTLTLRLDDGRYVQEQLVASASRKR